MHATSLGKAMLSGLTDKEIADIYPDKKLAVLTKKTISTFDALIAEIRQIRSRGWSIDDQENEKGTRCVGAPVFDYRDRVIAAVSLAWDVGNFPDKTWEDYAKHVVKCSIDISAKMGCPQGRIRQLAG
jgi:IclR family KDG regulon transcriptional repressor